MKAVNFGRDDTVIAIERRVDLNADDRTQRWFSKQELAEYRAEDRRCIRKLQQGALLQEDDFDARGLDVSKDSESSDAALSKLNAVQAVLDLQYRLRSDCTDLAERLAEVSQELTYQARKEARHRGKSDARCIPEIAERMALEKQNKSSKKKTKKSSSRTPSAKDSSRTNCDSNRAQPSPSPSTSSRQALPNIMDRVRLANVNVRS